MSVYTVGCDAGVPANGNRLATVTAPGAERVLVRVRRQADDLAVRRVALELPGGLPVHHGIEDSVPRANGRAVIGEWAEGDTDARPDISLVSGEQPAWRRGTGNQRVGRDEGLARPRQKQPPAREVAVEISLPVLHLDVTGVDFVTYAEIQSQPRADLPVILHERVKPERIEVARRAKCFRRPQSMATPAEDRPRIRRCCCGSAGSA